MMGFRASAEPNVSGPQKHVRVRRRHIDMARFDRGTVFRKASRDPGATQQ
jgi:hypothetical protein